MWITMVNRSGDISLLASLVFSVLVNVFCIYLIVYAIRKAWKDGGKA